MGKIWRELADPKKHRDFIGNRHIGGVSIAASKNNLIAKWVYFAEVNHFTFQFSSLEQVRECQTYFSQSVLPSTRETGHDLEHYWQAWFAKLPKGMNKRTKRERVLKALEQILAKWG